MAATAQSIELARSIATAAFSDQLLKAARHVAWRIAPTAQRIELARSIATAAFRDHVPKPRRSSRARIALTVCRSNRSLLDCSAQLLNARCISRPRGDSLATQPRSRSFCAPIRAFEHQVANAARCLRITNTVSTDPMIRRSSIAHVQPFHALRKPSPANALAANRSLRRASIRAIAIADQVFTAVRTSRSCIDTTARRAVFSTCSR